MRHFLTTFLIGIICYSNTFAQTIYAENAEVIEDYDYETFAILDGNTANNEVAAVIMQSEYMTRMVVFEDKKYPGQEVSDDIMQAVKFSLISKGYNQAEQNPDFYVSYRVYAKDGEITANFENDYLYGSMDRRKEYDVKKGSIIITVVDASTNEMVWIGVNDGALERNMGMKENRVIRSVTNLMERMLLD
jgi:hypothetical protein